MKRSILFDIDNTLVDTGKLVHQFIHPALAKTFNISEQVIANVHQQYKTTLAKNTEFNPDTFLEALSQKTNISIPKLAIEFYKQSFYEQSLYPETIEILTSLSQQNHPLGTYSEGVEKWQRRKLQLTKLDSFFDPSITFILTDKQTPTFIANLPQNAIVLDDRADHLETLLIRKDIQPIWINRKDAAIHPIITTITNLKQLTKVIK